MVEACSLKRSPIWIKGRCGSREPASRRPSLLPNRASIDRAILTISSVICEVLPLVSPVLEPVRAVTHVAELDALRGATADEAKEQDATLPLSREPDATQHGSAELVAILSEPDATHVVEQRALQVRDALPVLPCATRGAGQTRIRNGSPELDEIQFAGGTRFAEASPIAIRSEVVRWCEVPVAKAWPSIHLEVACSLVRFLMEPVAIRYGL